MTAPAALASWPCQMRAETAAAYLDEVSVEAFLRSVRQGLYPAPVAVPGKGKRWMIEDLDAARAKIRKNPRRPLSLKDRVGPSP